MAKRGLTRSEKSSLAKFSKAAARYRNSLSGLEQVKRNIDTLSKGMQTKAMTQAVSESGKAAVALIKTSIPSRYKDARKAIGWRRPKRRYNKGLITAKVGAAVGKKTAAKTAREAAAKAGRGKRKGIGIGARNIHWWFLGTAERKLGKGSATGFKAGHSTGKMRPKLDPVSRILRRHKSVHLMYVSAYAKAAIRDISRGFRSLVKAADKAGGRRR